MGIRRDSSNKASQLLESADDGTVTAIRAETTLRSDEYRTVPALNRPQSRDEIAKLANKRWPAWEEGGAVITNPSISPAWRLVNAVDDPGDFARPPSPPVKMVHEMFPFIEQAEQGFRFGCKNEDDRPGICRVEIRSRTKR